MWNEKLSKYKDVAEEIKIMRKQDEAHILTLIPSTY